MVEKIVQHTHCGICGKAIPINESFCSEDCRQKYQQLLKKRKMLVYIMYGTIIFIVAVFFITYYL
jgi:predicted nucleic acid-binding Zn ribbon protein